MDKLVREIQEIIEKPMGEGNLPSELEEKLISVVRSIPEFEIFDRFNVHFIGNTGRGVNLSYLVNWIFRRAQKVGSDQAVNDVMSYISNDSFQAYRYMFLTGLASQSNFELGDGVQFMNTNTIPSQVVQSVIDDESKYPLTFASSEIKPTSVLVYPFQHPRVHKHQDDQDKRLTNKIGAQIREIDLKLNDARLCFSLSGKDGYSPQIISVTTVGSDDVPILSGPSGWTVPYSRIPIGHVFHQPFTNIEIEKAQDIFDKFINLDVSKREHLRIPLNHLNIFMIEGDIVQKAVNLRTALESLLLQGISSGEYRFRLSLRGTLLLGGDIEKRKENFDLLKKTYNICSSAVHDGKIPSRYSKDGWEIIKETAQLIRSIIIKFIDNPMLDWNEIELAGGLNEDIIN